KPIVRRDAAMMKSMLAVALLLSSTPHLCAQSYPNQAINVVIPLAPGDAADIACRAMAEELSKLLKVPVIVANKPGAGGTLGTDSAVKAKKDGYTILLRSEEHTSELQSLAYLVCRLLLE